MGQEMGIDLNGNLVFFNPDLQVTSRVKRKHCCHLLNVLIKNSAPRWQRQQLVVPLKLVTSGTIFSCTLYSSN